MAKTKLRKFHKIKIHHNRWLIWAIAYVVLVSAALVYYVKISDLNIDADNTAQGWFQASRSYSDKRLGFSVKYPTSWSIEADSNTAINFVPDNPKDEGVTVTVVITSFEKSIRASLDIAKESTIYVDGVEAKKITNDLGKNVFETVVLATEKQNLYVIRGSNSFVDKFLANFRFISN